MSANAGPPPVNRSVQTPEDGKMRPDMVNYLTIVDTLKADGGAETRAIKAMFGGDQDLMNRFLAVAFSSLASNSDLLLNAHPMTIVQAIKDAASLGLEPTGLSGDGVIIRYGRTATFQAMWRGYLKRIRNSGKVQDLDCQVVYTNDRFDLRLGTDPNITHVPILPDQGERGDYRGVYAWALMPSGKYIIEWMTTADINYVRDHFSPSVKANQSGPWDTSWSEMARKTVIRRLAKRLPGAAVDQLLAVETKADQAAAEARNEAAKARSEIDEVRQIALRAVGQLPAGEPTNPEDQGASKPDEPNNPPSAEDGGEGARVPAAPEPETGGPGAEAEPEADREFEPAVGEMDPNVAAAMALADEQRKRYRRK